MNVREAQRTGGGKKEKERKEGLVAMQPRKRGIKERECQMRVVFACSPSDRSTLASKKQQQHNNNIICWLPKQRERNISCVRNIYAYVHMPTTHAYVHTICMYGTII